MLLVKCNKCYKEARTIEELELFPKGKLNRHGRAPICKECKNLKSRAHYQTIPDKRKGYRESILDKTYEYNKEYYLVNYSKIREHQSNYAKTNRHIFNTAEAKRKAVKLRATPKWLSSTDYEKIQLLYYISNWITNKLGVQMHVDHIIPLQGKYVSGFHCPSNLRVITAKENLAKSNKY